MEREISGQELLKLPVRQGGLELARPVDLVLAAEGDRVVGLEVQCTDGARRFLPLRAARIRVDEIAIGSALLLFEERDLGFYRSRGHTLRARRGLPVVRGDRRLGELQDIVLAPEGRISSLVVDGVAGPERLLLDGTVRVLDRGKAA